jgi:hypothetical protein
LRKKGWENEKGDKGERGDKEMGKSGDDDKFSVIFVSIFYVDNIIDVVFI